MTSADSKVDTDRKLLILVDVGPGWAGRSVTQRRRVRGGRTHGRYVTSFERWSRGHESDARDVYTHG